MTSTEKKGSSKAKASSTDILLETLTISSVVSSGEGVGGGVTSALTWGETEASTSREGGDRGGRLLKKNRQICLPRQM